MVHGEKHDTVQALKLVAVVDLDIILLNWIKQTDRQTDKSANIKETNFCGTNVHMVLNTNS